MQNPFSHCSETHRVEALAELRAELAEFSHDGLVQLIEDLKRGAVVRGSWTGCVISYKRGAAGSARRDRMGRARNSFTVLWDNGWLTDEEVIGVATDMLGSAPGARITAPPVPTDEDHVENAAAGSFAEACTIRRLAVAQLCERAA